MKVDDLQTCPTNVVQQIKKPDFIDRIKEHAVTGFKYISKVSSLFKASVKVSDAFTKIPGAVDEVTTALGAFKIVKGMLAIEKLIKSIVKICKPGDIKKRILAGWTAIKSTSKIVKGVEAVFKYLKKLDLISKSALAWATVTGWIFFPVKFISTALSVYKTSQKVLFMRGFRSRIALCKQPGQETAATAQKVCKQLLAEEKLLKKAKVITKETALKPKLKNIIESLKSDNEAVRQQAVADAKNISRCLKNRVREQVAVAAVKSSFKTVSAAAKIVGMTCPPAEVPLVIMKLVLKVASAALLVYSKFIPKGEITAKERPMFFALQFKAMRRMEKAFQVALAKLAIFKPQAMAAKAA